MKKFLLPTLLLLLSWLPIGAAPNIEVSIVVNPDETALLADRGLLRAGVGVDNVDVPAASERGVLVYPLRAERLPPSRCSCCWARWSIAPSPPAADPRSDVQGCR